MCSRQHPDHCGLKHNNMDSEIRVVDHTYNESTGLDTAGFNNHGDRINALENDGVCTTGNKNSLSLDEVSFCRDDVISDADIDRSMTIEHPVMPLPSNKKNPTGPILQANGVKSVITRRSKLYHTTFLCFSFFALGFNVGQRGPSFLDLQLITNTDIEKASTYFTAGSVGYLFGSSICGLLYDKFNNNLLLFLSTFGLAVSVSVLPLCSPYVLMLVMSWANSFFMGWYDTVANADLVSIWGSEGQSYMQILHFSFAFGGMLSPLITEPFLARQEIDLNLTSNIPDVFFQDNNISTTTMLTSQSNISTNSTLTAMSVTEIRIIFAYLISGTITLLSSIPFAVLYFQHRNRVDETHHGAKRKDEVSRLDLPLKYYISTLILVNLFFLFDSSVEDTFAAFIMTFVVMQLNWSKAQGSQITSVVWAAFAIMRFVGIFLIRYTTPVKLLFIFIVMSMLSLTGFLVCSHFAFSIGVWVFAALVGISVSTIFPTGVTWTNQALIKVTGKVTSSIIIACSIGSMINPVIIGYLMQELSPMWLCYLLLVQNIIYVVFFLILLYFAYVILIKVRCMKGTGNIDQNSDDSQDKNQCYVGIVTWM